MKKLVLFGASKVGEDAYQNLHIWNTNKFEDIFFCDNDNKKAGTLFCGRKIINFEELQSLYCKLSDNIEIYITSSYSEEIYFQCLKASIPILGIYLRERTEMVPYDSIFKSNSYSQCAEDSLFLHLYHNYMGEGFYVDIGAFHPYKYSNTLWAYNRGWKGINIEPNPDNFQYFPLCRDRDINLNYGVAAQDGTMDYYMYEDGAYNTFNSTLREKQFIPKRIKKVEVKTLESILDQYCPNTPIDFMNIDVETLELQVLKSNNWTKYRPKFIFVEQLDIDIENIKQDIIWNYMREQGYKLNSKLINTILYERQDD